MNKNEKDLINEYIEDCKKRLSHHTVKNHKSAIDSLKTFIGDVNIIYATKIDIRRFLNDLKYRKRSRSTIEGRLSSLNSFFKYIRTYHDTETVLLDDIDIMDYPKSRWEGYGTDALTKKDVRALIEAPDNIRDALIILILYYCGLRAEEITRIKIEDIDIKNRTIDIIGKGNKPRTVPYAKKLDKIIDLWLKRERTSYTNGDGPYFFPSKHGDKLTTSALYRIVYKSAEKANIQRILGKRADGSLIYKVHPHILRHSYATHAVEDGIPLNHVQEYMGHSNINTTLRYTGKSGIFKSYYKKFKGV